MKLFYICSEAKAREIPHEWHGLNLPSGKMLVGVRWKEDDHEARWANHPDVIRLPHPIFEATVPLTTEHHQHFANVFDLKQGHTIHDLLKQAHKAHPYMRLHVL